MHLLDSGDATTLSTTSIFVSIPEHMALKQTVPRVLQCRFMSHPPQLASRFVAPVGLGVLIATNNHT